jgi:hypothetical protein
VSALAGFANKAKQTAGIIISQREFTTYQVGSGQISILFLLA